MRRHDDAGCWRSEQRAQTCEAEVQLFAMPSSRDAPALHLWLDDSCTSRHRPNRIWGWPAPAPCWRVETHRSRSERAAAPSTAGVFVSPVRVCRAPASTNWAGGACAKTGSPRLSSPPGGCACGSSERPTTEIRETVTAQHMQEFGLALDWRESACSDTDRSALPRHPASTSRRCLPVVIQHAPLPVRDPARVVTRP